VWFKTRAGLVRVTGTVELTTIRFSRPDGAASVGLIAASHAQQASGHLDSSDRPLYLACFPAEEDPAGAVTGCLRRVEEAICKGQPVCDLSDEGSEGAWGAPADMVFVRKPIRVAFTLGSLTKHAVLVPTLVNGGGPHPFSLDSGASCTVLSAKLAERIGATPGEAVEGTGAGGRIQGSVTRVGLLGVQGAELPDVAVVIAEGDLLLHAAGEGVEGILGYNYLRNFRVTIDYPRGTLQLA
jgi:hypothetical protein